MNFNIDNNSFAPPPAAVMPGQEQNTYLPPPPPQGIPPPQQQPVMPIAMAAVPGQHLNCDVDKSSQLQMPMMIAPGNHARAWNDPPQFAVGVNVGSKPVPNKLNKRVPFPMASAPTILSAGVQPGYSVQQPPAMPMAMPEQQVNIAGPDLSGNYALPAQPQMPFMPPPPNFGGQGGQHQS